MCPYGTFANALYVSGSLWTHQKSQNARIYQFQPHDVKRRLSWCQTAPHLMPIFQRCTCHKEITYYVKVGYSSRTNFLLHLLPFPLTKTCFFNCLHFSCPHYLFKTWAGRHSCQTAVPYINIHFKLQCRQNPSSISHKAHSSKLSSKRPFCSHNSITKNSLRPNTSCLNLCQTSQTTFIASPSALCPLLSLLNPSIYTSSAIQ